MEGDDAYQKAKEVLHKRYTSGMVIRLRWQRRSVRNSTRGHTLLPLIASVYEGMQTFWYNVSRLWKRW